MRSITWRSIALAAALAASIAACAAESPVQPKSVKPSQLRAATVPDSAL